MTFLERVVAVDHRGFYEKFFVERWDGQSKPGKKHHGCRYFVLDLEHDPYVWPALQAYASACQETHPNLSKDLTDIIFREGINV